MGCFDSPGSVWDYLVRLQYHDRLIWVAAASRCKPAGNGEFLTTSGVPGALFSEFIKSKK